MMGTLCSALTIYYALCDWFRDVNECACVFFVSVRFALCLCVALCKGVVCMICAL
jgi:hypothetical protein